MARLIDLTHCVLLSQWDCLTTYPTPIWPRRLPLYFLRPSCAWAVWWGGLSSKPQYRQPEKIGIRSVKSMKRCLEMRWDIVCAGSRATKTHQEKHAQTPIKGITKKVKAPTDPMTDTSIEKACTEAQCGFICWDLKVMHRFQSTSNDMGLGVNALLIQS